ncbi:MAG: transaldolase [Elusimicrobia bacterium]|nr:transaldolase [Elusimicrobiota bacterium]
MNPLLKLDQLGQSVWLDSLSRSFIRGGELKKLIEEDGLKGVTTNPSIFEKAVGTGSDYDVLIEKSAAEGKNEADIFEAIATGDVRMAADVLETVYKATRGRDGYVSIEVSPYLAYDADKTVQEARRLWETVARPNVLVKVPGTEAGLPAVQKLLSEGINVNVTLLFSLERYEQVVEAYLSALEQRAAKDKPLEAVASVASFFVSRVDTDVDAALAGKHKDLLGKTAVANARLAYQIYKKYFGSERFKKLQARGAQTQRLLWASTSAKNPAYRDVLYVEELAGPDTVNTMPEATLQAFRDHGKARLSLEENPEKSSKHLQSLAAAGVDLDAVTLRLEKDGVRLFSEAMDRLLKVIAEKKKVLVS